MKDRINEVLSVSQQEWLDRHSHQKTSSDNSNNSLIQKILDMQESRPITGCSKCGIAGLHACPGRPLEPWSDEDRRKFASALSKYETPSAS